MSTTILTDEQKAQFVTDITDYGTGFVAPLFAVVESIEQAVLQSPDVQDLYGLLKESRHQLPLAAQFWNEADDSERGRRNVRHVLELIARVDAAMEKQP